MKFFLHTSTRIRIVNGERDIELSPELFMSQEAEYPGLPEGYIERYWTPERAYLSDGANHVSDSLDCEIFCDRIDTYITSYPAIYAHVSLSKDEYNISLDPTDSITFEAHLKASTDPEDPDLPVSETWLIPLRDENNEVLDRFKAQFVNGACSHIYKYKEGLPLGKWHLDENDFDLIDVPEIGSFQVKLLSPITFTLYREL